MISYPITSFPDLLTKEINIKSYLAECIDKPPKEPNKPTKQKTYEGCLIGLVFYIITAIVASGAIPLSISLPFGIGVTIVLWIVYSSMGQVEYNKNLNAYNAEFKKYLNDIQKYNKTLEQTQSEIEYLEKNRNHSWKTEVIKKRLIGYSFKLSSGFGKRDASEDYFIKQIEKYYYCRIFQNPPIYCKNIGFKYCPDIVLFFEENNIAIALEIDEPYTLKDGAPIHYYYNEEDIPIFSDEEVFSPNSISLFTSRTREIANEGFILIRFAEEQIVLQPDSCCKYINDKVKLHLGLTICKKDLSNIKEVKRVKTWTYDEAKSMFRNRYRENYLSKIGNYTEKEFDNSDYDDLPF